MEKSIATWAAELGYSRVPGKFFTAKSREISDHRYAPELREILQSGSGLNAEGVFCVDDVPTACLVSSQRLGGDPADQRSIVRALCERLWNQNLARVILIAGDETIEAWSIDNPDAPPRTFSSAEAIEAWSASGLVNGQALVGRDKWFDPKKRVDKQLLDSIDVLLTKLRDEGVAVDRARRLVARIIFVTYLEDRGIVGDAYRSSRKVKPLYELIGQGDADGLRQLFRHLRDDFNGDFLTTAEAEGGWQDISRQGFDWIHQFLSRTTLRSMQLSFWRYDFSHIPIELIASIYETFLAGGTETEVNSRRKHGAYYTPRVLADWVVDLAFDGRNALGERVFDPACGSGMLLTAAFRRLIRTAEARLVRQGKAHTASFAARKKLLTEHIFGADIDEDACQLTAFSLYLALLSDLDPSDLELLRKGGHKLPSLTDNIRRGLAGDFFSAGAANSDDRFTVLLSNPPWREVPAGETVASSMSDWSARQSSPAPHIPKRQIAAAFALGSADRVVAGGRVAMILPVNLFVSGDATQRQFRAHVAGRLRVTHVVNFSDMRRLIFADSSHPFVVLIAEVRRLADRFKSIESEQFEYWTPKADIALALGRLVVHGADRVVLPTHALLDTTPHLSIRYWGANADLVLLAKLRRHGLLGDLVSRHGWIDAKGFHVKDEDVRRPMESWYSRIPDWMLKRRFLATTRLPTDVPIVPSANLERFPFDAIAREMPKRLSEGPRVLWPDGISPEEGVRAVFADAPFTFRHTMAVLSAEKSELNRKLARFLTAYLRSPLGLWLLLLLSSSVASERPKLHVREALDWPFWHPEDHPDTKLAERILSQCDRLIQTVENAALTEQSHVWSKAQERANALVYSYFGLDESEIATIEELASFVGPAIQPGSLTSSALDRPLRAPPTEKMLQDYCRSLEAALSQWRDVTGGYGNICVCAWTARTVPIGAAVLTLHDRRSKVVASRVGDDATVDEIVHTLERLSSAGTSMTTFPDIALIDGNRILLVKPLIARFWLRRRALEDASQLAVELQSISARSSSDQADRN